MMLTSYTLTIVGFLCLSSSAQINHDSSDSSTSSLPVVDLGYERHRASYFNSTGAFYNFSNIRYAAPPTGRNRFAAPQAPATNRTAVQTGSPDRICPQANAPFWQIAEPFITLYLEGQTHFNASSFNTSGSTNGLPLQDPRATEDCLFLDVVVPKAIFDNAGKGDGAPVLVWIYGGGFTTGSKSSWGNPAGLLVQSETDARSGVIYVSFNYRLGAFGWLSGPTFQASGGVANAGLHDQRFALQWVQQYIHLFGGDPKRVTIFGESAGGGSIMHQITAYGGDQGSSSPPFAQAVLQSPAFFPLVSNQRQEQIFNAYLSKLNVSTLEQLQKLPYPLLQAANVRQVGMSTYGQYTYGPAVDGDFVPALPGELLLKGQFSKDLTVMVGHNSDEGLLFTSPFVQNNSAFAEQVLALSPTVKAYPEILDYIVETLYPPTFDGSQAMGYTNQIARTAAMISEAVITCNTFYLDKAYNNETYSYFFTIPPGLHGSDVPYTYYNGPNLMVVNTSIAVALQRYITAFAQNDSPNEDGVPHFPMYGNNATVLNLNVTGITKQRDPTANERCDWWQKALYY